MEMSTMSDSSFRDAILAGLSRNPKRIATGQFYDEQGSALFEAICRQPEYYVPARETALLAAHAPEIADLIGPEAALVEFGSCS